MTGDGYRNTCREGGSCVVFEPTRGRDDTRLRDASAVRARRGPIATRKKAGSFCCCVAVRGSHRTFARRFAMNLACAVSARAAGGAMAIPPTQPAAETQNSPLSAQKPIVRVERGVE